MGEKCGREVCIPCRVPEPWDPLHCLGLLHPGSGSCNRTTLAKQALQSVGRGPEGSPCGRGWSWIPS